ncbi:hypothetical protein ASPCAL02670 [Aspergillus calidoustus]|uniref:Uncharacterized protein n=1 Tax=Aspergillus calidoustus TaxID=454130 RepID=A0A0U5GPI9_ASPCI|nr:hypothetical protein ASPCAL02670 [Aspergillus calidoustus]
MHIFDLPLEIFHMILERTLPPHHGSHITQMQLVNKIFAREVLIVVFITRKWGRPRTWEPPASSYLCYRAMADDAHVYYTIRTVRQSVDWIVAQLSAEDRRGEICRALSRSAATRQPRPSPLFWSTLWATDRDGLDASYSERKTGHDQPSNAPTHRLSAAACVGDPALVQSLLEEGVDVNAQSDVFDSALVNAARWGHLLLVRLLIANGADVHKDVLHDVGGYQVSREEIDGGFSEDEKDFVGWFIRAPAVCHPLQAAALGGHEDIINLLLEPHLNLSRSSCTFFHSIISAATGGSANVLRVLMASADFAAIGPRFKRLVLDQALKKAAGGGHLDCMALLIDAGTPLGYNGDLEGQNPPLFYAAKKGQNKAIELLLDRGANVNLSRLAWDHPLTAAATAGYPRALSLLLDRGAVFNSNGDCLGANLVKRRVQACALKVILERGYHKSNRDSVLRCLQSAKKKKRWDLVALFRDYGVTPPKPKKLPA